MKKLAILLIFMPFTALAEERVFECQSPDEQHPEMAAKLIKYEDQNKGRIKIGDIDKEVDVFPGLDTLTYLYIGEDHTLSYNVHPQKGTFDFSASGSRTGWGKGTCTEITGQ
ncbi:hypothetical protein [Ruegeria faecimaris]|uniref:Membrane-bound lysozyme-inhibitor of c-type lysozyme n=1 Tax=Ruegeria faecimaris TaxID=686389 RepID=A0A521CF86_9RHOB|nr:hypothetical protein [Ruegeria faecimaris]SMO58088.1 hypothetical protein SAMN06265380_102395 [Ruegeria faecimaris]